jgi:type I restriction enzyme M protein
LPPAKDSLAAKPSVNYNVVLTNPENRHQRTETERFHSFTYEDLIKRDKANLDIFWLRDDSLGDSNDLPDPAILAAEIIEDLQAALDQFAQIAADLAAPDHR